MDPISASGDSSSVPSTSVSATTNTGSNLTEFTKRKNWSQRIIEELKDFLHVISPSMKLMYCSPSSQELVGYPPEELVGRSITEFIHVDDVDVFVRGLNTAVQQKSKFTLYYRFRRKDDKFIILEVNGHPYFDDHNPAACRCFFSTGRAYPSKATAMLDSFLELKLENENLRRQLRDLTSPLDPPTEVTPGTASTNEDITVIDDSNPLEMLTDLRDQEGGTSTSSSDPTLLHKILLDADLDTTLTSSSTRDGKNPLGIGSAEERTTITANTSITEPSPQLSTSTSSRRKKKPKVEEGEYVCVDCGTVESPEWRKGPSGPKTLCNACGLRWAKKTKKQASGAGAGNRNSESGNEVPSSSSGLDVSGGG